jgi:Rrf2 family protein
VRCLRCCAVLAGLPEDGALPSKALAAFHGVPKEYLGKALQALAQAGLVTGTLGPRGGYRLGRPAVKITFLDIVEAVEGCQSTFACTEIRRNNPCLGKRRPTGICAVARFMHRADDAWRKALADVTLADLQAQLLDELPSDLLASMGTWLADQALRR